MWSEVLKRKKEDHQTRGSNCSGVPHGTKICKPPY